jgi:hypothetical protein
METNTPEAKCQALFIYRLRQQGSRGAVTADWLKSWGMHVPTLNPPGNKRTPKTWEYLHTYDMEMAYVTPLEELESAKTHKQRLYTKKLDSLRAAAGQREMSCDKMAASGLGTSTVKPERCPFVESARAAWYRVIQDLILTNERLGRINIATTDACKY